MMKGQELHLKWALSIIGTYKLIIYEQTGQQYTLW